MAQTLRFSVDDTSPTISYSPFSGIFPPNLTAGWNPGFNTSGLVQSLGATGNGTSFHVTSHDNAVLSIAWNGTGIKLRGRLQGDASYNITLDGTLTSQGGADTDDGILAAFGNLPDNTHTVSINTIIPAGLNGSIYFDTASILFSAPSSASSQAQVLDDHNISFQGQWGFKNDSSDSFHVSNTIGDVARTNFSGVSFLLIGTTSPSAGTYSVIIDDAKSTLNGQSLSTNPDTLLFFVTGLDPTVSHDVQIINEDGNDLSLKVGGFQAFTTGLSSTHQSTSGSSAAHYKGTIAALVLAGILGFLIMSGSLYYFFVIRPQRRRRMQARLGRRRRKEEEVGALDVLDIAPNTLPDDIEMGNRGANHHQKRSSGKSGFSRWKREVEGSFGNLGLGITFRHSGSTGRKSRTSGGQGAGASSTKSSMFSLASKRDQRKGKKKAKTKHISESSWSASFALELPVRPDSADSDREKDIGPSHFSTDTHISLSSGLHTLSYMNTPSHPTPAPPSHSTQSSNGSNSNSLSVPRSILRLHSHSPVPPQAHGQQGTDLPLNNNHPITSLHEEDRNQSHELFVTTVSTPTEPGHLSTLAPRDRGSAQYSSDDAASVLGLAATRLAIRSLSPRMSQCPDMQSSSGEIENRTRMETSENFLRSADPAAMQSSLSNSETSFLNVATPANRPFDITPAAELPELLLDSAFLDVPPASPFMVDFLSISSQKRQDNGSSEPPRPRTPVPDSSEKENTHRNLRAVFRLTPPANPPSEHGASEATSFLDFGGSSEVSYRSRSVAPSEFSTQNLQPERSRWSSSMSQTTGLSRSGSSNVSIPAISPDSEQISYFPYPISLPPSPHHPGGYTSSRRDLPTPQIQQHAGRYPASALRLSAFGSPTDSVPMSVTDGRPRHSGSTGDSGGAAHSSQLPPHPPLPDMRPDVTPQPP